MAAKDTESIRAFIEEEAQAWAADYIAARAKFLQRRGIQASGDLVRSLEYDVRNQAEREAVETLMAFEEQGRFADMRTLQPAEGGANYITGLVDWQRKGLADKFTERYMERRKLKRVPERVLVYIAWGIARTRAKGKFRRRSWYNKSKSAAITDLFNKVAAGLPDIVSKEITKQLTDGSKAG